MNKLSIIITYYNNQEHIQECIKSIKKQRNQNFELIIVNDGSTDSSNIILEEELKTYDKEITFIHLDSNKGHAHARNVALDSIDTQYVMFLDADDHLASYSVEYYLSKINGTDGLIAPIHKFTINKPQYVNKDKIRVEYLTQNQIQIHF